ncbi:hypothetical protein ATCC90586_007853 [Pythium insidiosum]|nr:hypothetical protein ATCC90586_007853 [Pythium insidiosum]
MEEPAEQMEENTLEIPTETAVAPRAATTVRRNERGEIIRWKARFVALGFLQHFGVDCFETYATVANMSSIRNFLSVCCAAGFVMERLDADTAYLNSDLEEDVYIETPEGLNDDSKCVLKLKKALYGLKQAGNTWFETIQRLLVETGFKPCGGDTCVLVERVGNEFIYICLYVVVVAARTSELVDDVKRAIASRFRIKELGYVRHLLGMKIANDQKARTMTVAQTQCIKTIVNRFNQQGARNVTNPCDQRLKLSMADAPQAADEKEEMSKFIYICLYVVVVAARTSELVDDVKRAIASRFRIKELGYVRHLLGMKIANDQKARTMTVAQTQCIKTIVNRFNQQGARNVTNPCDQRLKLSMADAPQAADEKEEMSKKPYQPGEETPGGRDQGLALS